MRRLLWWESVLLMGTNSNLNLKAHRACYDHQISSCLDLSNKVVETQVMRLHRFSFLQLQPVELLPDPAIRSFWLRTFWLTSSSRRRSKPGAFSPGNFSIKHLVRPFDQILRLQSLPCIWSLTLLRSMYYEWPLNWAAAIEKRSIDRSHVKL